MLTCCSHIDERVSSRSIFREHWICCSGSSRLNTHIVAILFKVPSVSLRSCGWASIQSVWNRSRRSPVAYISKDKRSPFGEWQDKLTVQVLILPSYSSRSSSKVIALASFWLRTLYTGDYGGLRSDWHSESGMLKVHDNQLMFNSESPVHLAHSLFTEWHSIPQSY